MENLFGLLELPKYVDEEIKKSIDINVDELVKNRKDLPDVVLRSLYDEVVSQDLTNKQNSRIETLEDMATDLTNNFYLRIREITKENKE